MSCLPGMSCFQNTSYSSGCGCGGYTTIYYPNGCSSSQCLSSNYVCYSGPNQPNSGVNNGDTLTDIIQKIDAALLGLGTGTVTSIGLTSTDIIVGGTSPITTSGTFTLTLPNINTDIGTFNNLTVNAKGQVTSASNVSYLTTETDPVANAKTVTLTGGTGISILGAAQTIGSNPAFTITNSAPDQIVTLTEGSNISISGTYPSFTISATGGGGGITNSAVLNELMKSDGTNAVPSGIGSTTAGDITLGLSTTAGSFRSISAIGNGANIGLYNYVKGIGDYAILNNSTVSFYIDGSDGYKALSNKAGFQAPDRNLHLFELTSTTNSVVPVLRLEVQTSGVAANGLGTGIEFEIETSAGPHTEIGSIIESVVTDVTLGSEDFDLVFKTMAAGAAAIERLRINDKYSLFSADIISNDSTKGVVLKSPDNHYWRITVDNTGALSTTDLGTSLP